MIYTNSDRANKKKNRLWIAALVVAIVAILFRFALESHLVSNLFSILEPITIGVALAYLINPLMMLFEKLLHALFSKIFKRESIRVKICKTCRGFAVFFSMILFFGLVFVVLSLIVPELYTSLSGLVTSLPAKLQEVSTWYSKTAKDNGLIKLVGDPIMKGLTEWSKNIDSSVVFSTLLTFTNGAVVALKTILHIIVGIIVAIYILLSKELLCAQIKKVLYACIDIKNVDRLILSAQHGHTIMSRFIIGKIIDSAIIGVITLIAMIVFRLPYAVLVSVIVGITNVIPYFGPFLGAVPSALLIFINDPIQGLTFAVMIFAIQQLDGNLIGPMILGDSTGLSPFWVMFAIIVGGGLFGFIGMVVGVPILAFVFFIVREWSNSNLSKKNMPVDLQSYTKEISYDFHWGKKK